MAIARITTWVDGQILTAGALNAEFDNILNNSLNLISPLTAPINMNQQAANNFVVGTNTVTTNEGGLSMSAGTGLLLWNDGTTQQRIMGPNSGISRVSGLRGSLISNIGSFAALRYQLQRNGSFGNEIILNVSCTSSFSINTQTVGPIAGGRDQAAVFASDEVHFYGFAAGTRSTTIAGICSTRPPPIGPVLSGQQWVYLCSAKYSTASSAVVVNSIVNGSKVVFSSPIPTLGVTTTATSFSSTTPALAPSLRVPAIASHMCLWARLVAIAYNAPQTGVTANYTVTSESTPIGDTMQGDISYNNSATGNVQFGQSQGYHTLAVGNAGPVLVTSGSISTGTAGFSLTIDLHGYTVANGDN